MESSLLLKLRVSRQMSLRVNKCDTQVNNDSNLILSADGTLQGASSNYWTSGGEMMEPRAAGHQGCLRLKHREAQIQNSFKRN